MSKNNTGNADGDKSAPQVRVSDADETSKPARRTFPGPRGATDRLRVAVDRSAYAELIAHAKGSLAAEVCGVLAGQVCEDDEGLFVHVSAMIRGTSASEGSTHVTFTQQTWNAIHKVLEHDFPKLKIVGWYHTHPGFGVEFSEMDVFIQRNFFGGPAQVALVTDPVNGDVAICLNTQQGIEYLQRFWIDGREQQCKAPKRGSSAAGKSASAGGAGGADSEAVQSLETRVGQLVQSLDEMRAFHYRFMVFCGGVFCLALVAIASYSIYSQWGSRLEPPKVNQIVPVPVRIGDKAVILGVGVTSWEVPPELNALLLEEMEKEAKAKAVADAQARTNNPPGSATNSPAAATNPAPPAAQDE